jgi:hypothetical protein
MSENHDEHGEHEGPIHQAVWVFPLTVIVCYLFLVLVMGAKWAAESVDFAEFMKVIGIQAAIFAAFLGVFGGLVFLANKLVGATDATE